MSKKEEIQQQYNNTCAELGQLRWKRHQFDKAITVKLLEIEKLDAEYGECLRAEKESQADGASNEA